MVSDRFRGLTVNIAGSEKRARLLWVNFKQRKYLYPPTVPVPRTYWLCGSVTRGLGTKHFPLHHHRLFKGWASLYWNVSGELSMNLSLVLPPHPQMKRQFYSSNKIGNKCGRIGASFLRAGNHPWRPARNWVPKAPTQNKLYIWKLSIWSSAQIFPQRWNISQASFSDQTDSSIVTNVVPKCILFSIIFFWDRISIQFTL